MTLVQSLRKPVKQCQQHTQTQFAKASRDRLHWHAVLYSLLVQLAHSPYEGCFLSCACKLQSGLTAGLTSCQTRSAGLLPFRMRSVYVWPALQSSLLQALKGCGHSQSPLHCITRQAAPASEARPFVAVEKVGDKRCHPEGWICLHEHRQSSIRAPFLCIDLCAL